MDSEFPDIFAKPGQFLPGIFDQQKSAGFEEDINIEHQKKLKAKELQDQLIKEK